MEEHAPPLALTMGEPGGVGLRLALPAWRRLHRSGPAFCLLADPALLRARAARCGVDDVPLRDVTDIGQAATVFRDALPVLALSGYENLPDRPGEARPDTAAAVLAAIDNAVALTLRGAASGVVTLPIQKEALYAAGFSHEGHTDHLAALARQAGHDATPVMMLSAADLRTVPVTVHVALADVPARLSEDAIVAQGRVLARDLNRFFAVGHPRIAVAALNPHAGEGGRMGSEERTIITPAIERLKAAGIDATGPHPADTLFHEDARGGYDACLCMYHDQALIPVKTLDFHGGVNVTLGLPFVRTSPDHGTALDLAAGGAARADSLINALRLAARMAAAERARAS